ncbi:toll/interleukin-1 receptor domain-containing protein [Desulfococcaceae bacterium HSG8]|nr:toll/interleukin-1 receptor domain-containing protein [Desulfococcaceae bacterium HSG8]
MNKAILISHSSRDDNFVAELCKAMEAYGLFSWMDSSDLRGGGELTVKIHAAIEKARAFIVVISPDAFNSAWVAEETRHAALIKERRKQNFPVIALLREGIELGALKWIFSKEPVAIRLKDGKKGIHDAMPHILAALGERVQSGHQLEKTGLMEPLEELVMELKFPHIMEKDGKRRAMARAELTYIPAGSGSQQVKCRQAFLFTAPLGPLEVEELRWYLERYYLWPTGVFRTRAENIEKKLPEWGQELYLEVMPKDICDNVISAWKKIDIHAERRFSVFVDSQLIKGASKEKQYEAEEATALLLGLPWELMHDGKSYLFQGARSVRSRHRLPEG